MDLKDIQVSRRDTGVDELAAEVGNSGGVQGDKWGRMEMQHALYEPLYVFPLNQGNPLCFTLGVEWDSFVNLRNNSAIVV